MSNAIGEEIEGKYVVIRSGYFKPEYNDISYRVMLATGGFGCNPNLAGAAVFGVTPFDGDKIRVHGSELERFATDEEIALVTTNQEEA